MLKICRNIICTFFFAQTFATDKFKKLVSPEGCGIAALNKNFSRLDLMFAEHRLIGGIESRPHSWPWTGELIAADIKRNKVVVQHRCGCALIDPEFVITAAHCFAKSRLPKRYRVLFGGHKIFSGREFQAISISIHPFYQLRASAYDVALIKIAPEIGFNDYITPICLPAFPVQSNSVCVVTGWGRIQENGSRANSLREIHVPVIPSYVCNDYGHYRGRMHYPSMICAGFETGQMDACQGDSGGPLQCQNYQGIWELQGVVSWGIGCGKPGYPGVYTKISTVVSWIRLEMMRLA